MADALATMSSMFKVKWDNEAPRIIIWKLDKPAYCCDLETEEATEKPWYHEVKRYLEAQKYPEGASVNDKKFLSVFGDSALVINQIKGEWDMKHPNLIPYKEYVLTLLPQERRIS